MAGHRGAPRPEVPQPEGRRVGQEVGGRTPGGPNPAGLGEQAGLQTSLQSRPGVPCDAHQPEPQSR